MESISWKLLSDGYVLEIYAVDPKTRRTSTLLSLKRRTPMSEPDALKYVNDNYPSGTNAVRKAAETLGMYEART